MHALRLAGLMVVTSLLALGCAPREQQAGEEDTPMLSTAEQTAEQLRRSYQQADPDARVGVVMAVRDELRLAAVGQVPVSDFRDGDTITFIDLNEQVLAHGTVASIEEGLLVVRYEPAQDGRDPRVGDLAIRVK